MIPRHVRFPFLTPLLCLTPILCLVAAETPPPAATPPPGSPPVVVTIDARAPRPVVSPELYGIFFEEINHAGEGGLYAEMVDDHFYVSPDRFFRMADSYDRAPRDGPKIYVGEYAVNRNVGRGSLWGALAEAVFMLNMERNSDVVRLCSYAPLFENVHQRDWPVNLIP